MRIPKLKVVGICNECKREVDIKTGSLCNAACTHKFRGQKCRGSDYSVQNTRFVIRTEGEARQVAVFFRNNTGGCLDGGSGHSMACGDGRDCEETLGKLAREFASYYLAQQGQKAVTKKAA